MRKPALPSLDLIKTEKARRSLHEFLVQAWPILEPASPFVDGWHIHAICEHLEALNKLQIRNLIINMPPRSLKSILVSVAWPCWSWIDNPELRWLFSSYSGTLSTRDSIKCRRLILDKWYQDRFGSSFSLSDDQNQKTRFENNRTGYRIATSVGGTGTGEGGDMIVVDDPHNVTEADSEAIVKATIDWWGQSMSTRGNNPNNVRKVIVMQRLREDDLSGHCLAQGGYEHLCLPMRYEEVETKHITCIGWSDPRTKAGELLQPNRFTEESVKALEVALGSEDNIAGQLQQNPVPKGGAIIKAWWWRYWQPSGWNLPPVKVQGPDGELVECPVIDLPEEFDEMAQSWDMTFVNNASSDLVAGGVYARKGARVFKLDQVYERLSFVQSVTAVRELSQKWPRTLTKLVENKANGPAIISMLEAEIPGLIAVNPEGDKLARCHSVAPTIRAGNVFLPHPMLPPEIAGWVRKCKHQIESFPKGAHDDIVDETTQLLRYWGPKYAFATSSVPYSVSLPWNTDPNDYMRSAYSLNSIRPEKYIVPFDVEGRIIPNQIHPNALPHSRRIVRIH